MSESSPGVWLSLGAALEAHAAEEVITPAHVKAIERIAELEAFLAKLPSDRERLLLEDSARLRALLAESQAALSKASRDLMDVSLEARGLGNPAVPSLELHAAEAGWRPIETAPKDGYMLVHEDDAIRALLRINGEWHKIGYPAIISHSWGDVIVGNDAKRFLPTGYHLELRDGCCDNPTEWMPLPAPPEPGQQGRAPSALAERSDDQICSRCGRYENGSRPCPNGDHQCPVSYAPTDLGVGE